MSHVFEKFPLCRIAALLLVGLTTGCYSAEFTKTGQFSPTVRPAENVEVFTTKPVDSGFREVGIIASSGASFAGALKRARAQGASHGCEGLLVVTDSVESGRNTPGSAYGMVREHLRCSCLVH